MSNMIQKLLAVENFPSFIVIEYLDIQHVKHLESVTFLYELYTTILAIEMQRVYHES